MAADAILIQSDILSRVATSAQKKYVKDKLPKVDRKYRPYLDLLESIDEPHTPSGEDGAISDAFKFTPGLGGQWWNGLDTIQAAVDVNDTIRFETTYCRFVTPVRLIHDEWLRRGWLIEPHSPGKSIESRMRQIGDEALMKLRDQLAGYLETVNESHEVSLDLAFHKQGASVKEPLGLNGQLPLGNSGTWLGLNKSNEPLIQHIVTSGTVGASGTFIPALRDLLRELQMRAARSGIAGQFYLFAGKGWLNYYHDECIRLGITRNAEASGVTKMDYVIMDDALNVGGLKPIWDPTLDNMDLVASSEKGVGASPNAVTFSAGGGTTQATGYAVTNGSGAISAIVVLTRGAGYTSAPTVAVATGTGATFQAYVFVTGSGAGLTTVQADDYRIGQLDRVVVTAGGSGYTNGTAVNFTDRAYFIFKPALKYRTIKGIRRTISIPADPRNVRQTELQLETGSYHYVRAPRLCAIHHKV